MTASVQSSNMTSSPANMDVIFISDLHFGGRYKGIREDRMEPLVKLLESLPGRASHLFILGDLFEFWMEYRHYIPKEAFPVLVALSNCVRSGVEVHYLAGNHDFSLGSFFPKQLGVHIHMKPLVMNLQGRRCYLLHGDGMAKSDWAYRIFIKKILQHPISQSLYRLLHPDFGMGLARFVSGYSRDRHGNIPRHLDEYEANAREILKQGYDAVLHGHVHAAFIKNFPEGAYVCTGEWFQRLNHVVMRGGQFFLHEEPKVPF